MDRYSDAREALDALLEQLTPKLRKAFIDLVADVRNTVLLQELIAAIEAGDFERAFNVIGLNRAAMRPMTKIIEEAFETGGIYTGKTFPKFLETSNGKAVFRFDVRNKRAEDWLREKSSEFVTKIEEETRQLVRNVAEQGMIDGRNPRNVALDLVGRKDSTGNRVGGAVGLTPQQEKWVQRAKRQLEKLDKKYLTRDLRDGRFNSIVERAIKEGKPLSSDQINKMIMHYRNRVLQYRGEVIARTEMIAALNRSEWEAINQAADLGAVPRSATVRIWDSVGNDGRTRPTHLMMEGQTVGLDEPFTFPGGKKAMYPGDTSLGAPPRETIMCRCKARTKVDWLAGVAKIDVDPEDRKALKELLKSAVPR